MCFIQKFDSQRFLQKREQYYKEPISKVIVGFYVDNLIKSIEKAFEVNKDKFETLDHISDEDSKGLISFSKEFQDLDHKFKRKMKDMILHSHLAEVMDGRSSFIIRKIVKAYISNMMQLPDDVIMFFLRHIVPQEKYHELTSDLNDNFTRNLPRKIRSILSDPEKFNGFDFSKPSFLLRIIADYISGMTDQYATDKFNMLYGSKEVSTL